MAMIMFFLVILFVFLPQIAQIFTNLIIQLIVYVLVIYFEN